MIFVDYPPGGLGNFVAQILTNNISHENHVSFHRSKTQTYDAVLSQSSRELFLKTLDKWRPQHQVCIGHSWGAVDHLKRKHDCRVYSIRVGQCWPELFLNVYNKAMVDNATANKHPSVDDCDNFYNYMLRMFDFDRSMTDITIDFDSFYGSRDQFLYQVNLINPEADGAAVYNKFCITQQLIVDRLKYLKDLAQLDRAEHDLASFEKVLLARLQHKTSVPQNPSKVHGLDC